MSWIMEVRITLPEVDPATGLAKLEWRAVRATGAPEPYQYDTREEAEAMLRMCYPDQTRDRARVREVYA